ncbi:hypothetical protein CL634_01085 [bacterium]|nr:hypothetical protein [bacterium]
MTWDRTKQADPMTYKSYCTFVYKHMVAGREYTTHALFPPLGREDTYGGMTETEIRTLAFERLNELEKRQGKVEVILE